MSTMLITFNGTRENGNFMGDQLCALKTAYLFVENQLDVDRVVMSVSPDNEMAFLWTKFVDKFNVELIYDNWNPGDWNARHTAWDTWHKERRITSNDGRVIKFDHMRQLYLRIHGAQRQTLLCGSERGLGRRNIYQYWWCGQEHCPDELPTSVDWFDDTLIHHPELAPERDVYISPHCKTQGNYTFTFEFWANVVRKLLDSGVTVTVGYDGAFWDYEFNTHPLYHKHWGDHKQWMDQVCRHKLVACGNTGTGWLAAACGTPMITMEPPNSQMPDHRYRECGLRNIVEVVVEPDATYVARRIIEEVRRCVVMTTGCYDILHAGHVRHLQKCRSLGTKLIVAMNSDQSVRRLKGGSRPINPQNQRKAVLEGLRSVDEVRIVDDPMDLVREVRPNILAVGYGYTLGTIVGRDFVESYGGRAVVTCTGDAKDEPSTTKIVNAMSETQRIGVIYTACRAASGHSINPPEKLRLIAEEFLKVAHLSGDVADLGSYRGGIALVLRRLAPDRHLHLFDTWCGIPYSDPLCHHKQGEWAASLEDCKTLVGNNDKTWYWQGVFPTSAEGIPPSYTFSFVYVDMDTYQATRDALEFFWPRMVQGGVMFLDDYGWEPCAGVKKAVDEYFPPEECEQYKYETWIPKRRVIQSQYTCVLEKP